MPERPNPAPVANEDSGYNSSEPVQETLTVTIVIPARNEADSLDTLLPRLRQRYPGYQLLVIDDGSTDDTAQTAREQGAEVISHPYNLGNGAAVKTGARVALSDILVFLDGDGQHAPEDIHRLIDKLSEGYDMVIGARAWSSHANFGRGIANTVYNRLASWMVGHEVPDLTSGLRAARKDKFREFLYLLPNGFSYPTTSTMAFFRAGYKVAYVPIRAASRQGKSHINIFKDGLRFLLIIFKVGTLYSPLKLFFPISLGFFSLGLSYYGYTFFTEGRFTNMSALLFITSILIFLIGLVSEQVTTLLYAGADRENRFHRHATLGTLLSEELASSEYRHQNPYAGREMGETGRKRVSRASEYLSQQTSNKSLSPHKST
jgi:glycosyltransferase involved in cell wall biosynthesis